VKDGRTNFSGLQADLAKGRQDRLLFYAFDILYLDGVDLRRSPQIERKLRLEGIINQLGPPILYSEHIASDGERLFEYPCKLNYDRIVSKKADAPYRSERGEA
jgi:bifunctional non-homologous end joining protein LigD